MNSTNATANPLILIVEDRPDNLKQRVDLFNGAGCFACGVRTSDDAIQELSGASPGFDLVFTDINLNPETNDKSGMALANYIKSTQEDLPIAGYSAFFEKGQLSKDELEVFDLWFEKGSLNARRIQEIVEECRNLATEHRRSRRDAKKRLSSLRDKYEFEPSNFETLRHFIPGGSGAAEIEETLRKAGYDLRLVEPGFDNSLLKPVIVWVRKVKDSFEVEVFNQFILYSVGKTEDEALQNLFELMELFAKELVFTKDSIKGPAYKLYQFLLRVLKV